MGLPDIIAILIILSIPAAFIIAWCISEIMDEKMYALFKPGMTMEFYKHKNHGKFEKEELFLTYEVLDVDGRYAWVKNIDTGYETETDLYMDCKYSDKLVLKDSNGNVVKTFKFKL